MARILVLDEDAPLRNLLCDVLEEEGYRLVEAHNSYEGLRCPSPASPEIAIVGITYLVAF